MKTSYYNVMKILIMIIIIIVTTLLPYTKSYNSALAFIALIFSVMLLYKGRNNIPLTLMFIFIFYSNYSVIVGEYLIAGNLSVPFTEVKNDLIYGIAIKAMLIFVAILALFYNGKFFEKKSLEIKPVNNSLIFYSLLIMLVFSLYFGVDRGSYLNYSVRVSPIFEYSKLLFLFAFYYSGNLKFRKALMTFLMLAFIIQDIYTGGRITTLQLLILFTITVYLDKVTFRKIILYSGIGIVLNNLVAVYRNNFSIEGISVLETIQKIFENYFVFDTATFSYYATGTHIATTFDVGIETRISSFFEFFKSIFIGSNSITSDVTTFVSQNFHYNMGGGYIFSWFYFWFGFVGVIFIAMFIVKAINNLMWTRSNLGKLIYIAIIFNTPRWYLYSPNQLFRGSLFFVTLIWGVLYIVNNITKKKKSISKANVQILN